MSFLSSASRLNPKILGSAIAAVRFARVPFVNNTKSAACVGRASFSTSSSDTDKPITAVDMTKIVAETHELSAAQSRRILNTVFDTITESLANGKAVSIANFGKFSSYVSKERKGVNPSTGSPLLIPSRKRVKFSAFTDLKNTVNGEKN